MIVVKVEPLYLAWEIGGDRSNETTKLSWKSFYVNIFLKNKSASGVIVQGQKKIEWPKETWAKW